MHMQMPLNSAKWRLAAAAIMASLLYMYISCMVPLGFSPPWRSLTQVEYQSLGQCYGLYLFLHFQAVLPLMWEDTGCLHVGIWLCRCRGRYARRHARRLPRRWRHAHRRRSSRRFWWPYCGGGRLGLVLTTTKTSYLHQHMTSPWYQSSPWTQSSSWGFGKRQCACCH